MEFDKNRVYTALNADELKVGSKIIVADTIDELKQYVEHDCDTSVIEDIMPGYYSARFHSDNRNYNLAYLISVPQKDWIVYLSRRGDVTKPYLTSCRSDCWEVVQKDYGAKTKLFVCTEDESEEWYEARKHLTNEIAAWEDGKTIQYNSGNGWEDCCDNKPAWDINSQYRIKPEGLKWTDLKIGDIITNSEETFMIIGIDTIVDYDCHILAGDIWIEDTELKNWEKVE